MKIAIAGWHYAYRTMAENIRFFAQNGFDLFSALGIHFVEILQNETDAAEVASAISESGIGFSVHYGLADPKKPEDVEKFYASLDAIRAWQKKYGLLDVLSFDVWFPNVYPQVERAVTLFDGSGTKIAFEDFCLNGFTEEYAKLYAEHPFYELLDAGHMNIRLFSKTGDHSEEAFREAIRKIPLPVLETHIHNNRGLKDMHAPLLDPTLNAERIGTFDAKQYIRLLKELGMDDVIVTNETIPHLYGCPGEFGDYSAINDLRYVRKLIELEEGGENCSAAEAK